MEIKFNDSPNKEELKKYYDNRVYNSWKKIDKLKSILNDEIESYNESLKVLNSYDKNTSLKPMKRVKQ